MFGGCPSLCGVGGCDECVVSVCVWWVLESVWCGRV